MTGETFEQLHRSERAIERIEESISKVLLDERAGEFQPGPELYFWMIQYLHHNASAIRLTKYSPDTPSFVDFADWFSQ